MGCAVLGFGISVEVAPWVLMVPGEGIVQAIAVVTGRQFGNVKTAFDATLVSTALLLSLLFFHRLQGLGIGTIFSALAVGRFVDLYNRRLPLISCISALRKNLKNQCCIPSVVMVLADKWWPAGQEGSMNPRGRTSVAHPYIPRCLSEGQSAPRGETALFAFWASGIR